MKEVASHPRQGMGRSLLSSRHLQSLLRSRDEIKVLIQTIESDRNVRIPSWQIGSLRRTLEGIESQLRRVGVGEVFAKQN